MNSVLLNREMHAGVGQNTEKRQRKI